MSHGVYNVKRYVGTGVKSLLVCVAVLLVWTWRVLPDVARYTTDLNLDSCTVDCRPGVPCQYKDELDFRVIVLTYNRPASLRKCLQHVSRLDTLTDNVGVEIWIDRGKDGSIDAETLDVSRDFQTTWTGGRTCVHMQPSNVYIMGQWVDTWRPRKKSREMVLFIEDDVDISAHAYHWLKAVHPQTTGWSNIAGYTLQSENVNFFRPTRFPVSAPETDTAFLYRLIGTWGYSPRPQIWRDFQDWFHKQRDDPNFRPRMPGTVLDQWYKEQTNKDSMWAFWFIYYCDLNKLDTLYPNLAAYTGRQDVQLEYNRQEQGLHFSDSWLPRFTFYDNILTDWDSGFGQLPEKVVRYDLGGEVVNG